MNEQMNERGSLSIDFITCDGLGFCAEELPENIRLDDWGYPIIMDDSVSGDEMKRARRAARACPVAALRLQMLSEVSPFARIEG